MAVSIDMACDYNEAAVLTDIITQDGTPTGTPVDITGWGLLMVIHKTLGDNTPLKSYTIGSGITVTNAAGGTFTITIPVADVQAIGAGDWQYYIQRTDPGFETDLTKGVFTIRAV